MFLSLFFLLTCTWLTQLVSFGNDSQSNKLSDTIQYVLSFRLHISKSYTMYLKYGLLESLNMSKHLLPDLIVNAYLLLTQTNFNLVTNSRGCSCMLFCLCWLFIKQDWIYSHHYIKLFHSASKHTKEIVVNVFNQYTM